jgi:hypothetical protein
MVPLGGSQCLGIDAAGTAKQPSEIALILQDMTSNLPVPVPHFSADSHRTEDDH